uniref:Reverse transcriptase domain-containing protein n=1 Tax=Tanacetum cinerariifolium TaxID=118510 RepID=A0A6L2MQR1_TANCI|nr:reverse transcriptase domain-containing protein [Tanacetum cinerariifolium]
MEELCQPSLNGRGGPIASIAIQATNFGLKNDMIQQMAKMFLGKYFAPSIVTKLRNEITNFRQRPDESLFEAWERGTFMKRRPEECYDLIENMTTHHNDWDTSAQRTTVGQTQNIYATGAYQGGNSYQPQDALILMPKFGLTIKTLLTNKDELYELTRTSLNEHCSAVLLKKLPEKLGDPGKFLIPCDFLGMDECLALADLSASINLMPLSAWNKLSLPELSPTRMTLELADRSISRPVGVTEDVFVKTKRALIDVFDGELTLRIGKEAITFKFDQTSRCSANYKDMTTNRINVIDMACEEYS